MRACPNTPRAMLEHLRRARRIVEEERAEAKKMAELGVRYPDLGAVGYDQTTITLFERLVEQPCMDPVWVKLSKVFDDTKEVPDTCQFANACNEIYKAWSSLPIRQPGAHREHFNSLARDLMAIANKLAFEPEFGAIGRVPANLSAVDLLADDAIKGLAEGYLGDIDGDDRQRVAAARAYLRELIPDFHAHARSLAAHAIRVAAELPVSRQAARATAGRTYFQQNLSGWLEGHLGGWLRGGDKLVSEVASALFPEFEADTPRNARNARNRAREAERA